MAGAAGDASSSLLGIIFGAVAWALYAFACVLQEKWLERVDTSNIARFVGCLGLPAVLLCHAALHFSGVAAPVVPPQA